MKYSFRSLKLRCVCTKVVLKVIDKNYTLGYKLLILSIEIHLKLKT